MSLFDTKEKSNKKDEELLQWWKDEIKRALKFRKDFGLDDSWERNRDYYRHNFKEGELNLNLVYASIASEGPSIIYNFPHISVSATRPGFEPFAYMIESIDNNLSRQQNLSEELEDSVIDVATTGVGAFILGYDSQYGFSRKSPGATETGETTTHRDSKTFDRLEYDPTVQRGMPWCMRCLPDNFLVPWGTSRYNDAPWMAFRVVRPLRDVQADEKYDKKARTEVNPIEYPSKDEVGGTDTQEHKLLSSEIPKELQPVYMWQIHDRRSGQVLLISEGSEYFLRKENDALQSRLGLPAETLQFTKDPIWFWGIPEMRYYMEHQREMNEILDQRRAHRRAEFFRFFYDVEAIKEDEVRKLLSGKPVMGIPVKKPVGGKMADVITTFQPVVPRDFSEIKQDLRSDVREITGKSKPYMGEQLGKTHITAKETDTAMQQAGGRDAKKREKVARFLERIMSKENEIIFKHWTQKRVEQVVGPDLSVYWVEFTGQQLRSDYVIQVGVDDMAPLNRDKKLAEAGQLLELFVKDQQFSEMYPEAAMQVRKTILSQYSWLNFRNFEPREGVGGNPQQPMSMDQFAGGFRGMQQKGKGGMAVIPGGKR